MSDKFVVSTNEIGRIIVTDVETGNVYHHDNLSNFLGLIRLLNEQQDTINNQEQRIKILQQEISDTQAVLEMLVEKLKGWNDDCQIR